MALMRVAVTPESAGWSYTSLWIAELAAGASLELTSGPDEIIVLPLSGSAQVRCDGGTAHLRGRRSVWHGPSDFAYVGRNSDYRLHAETGGTFALCGARARRDYPFRYVPARAVDVELRGAGVCSRQVNNFAMDFPADTILACEVLTPGGNWSTYPAHRHDGLEEIYYFQIHESPGGAAGFGYFQGAEVHTGEVRLVPSGYHGPAVAAPGHHMYYLNVMGGPVRAWDITDHPDQAWIRDTWDALPIDARLPFS